MNKKLVIVESPAKARTIGRFLGKGVDVLASMGHVRDLPATQLGVDIAHEFTPAYQLTPNGRKIIKQLKAASDKADEIYLATDPDREGEAIAWHLKTLLDSQKKKPFHRIAFHEITKNAIANAITHPTTLAMDLVDAQQARRVLDRIVGYQVSPMLWKNIQKGTSAGRVQSVALRLIVEREREILAFKPEEYWNLTALFSNSSSKVNLKTHLTRINNEKKLPVNVTQANRLADALQSSGVRHVVQKVTTTPRKQNAAPPFITSTMQQAAGSILKFGTTQTMRIAQELYEGVELGSGGAVGLITYMRTDSVHISQEAQAQARSYIQEKFGAEYVPEKPNNYRSRKSAQEAHEAIRPTDIRRTPDELAGYLTPQQLKLYRLVWNRFLASQMSPARQLDHVIEIESSGGDLDNFQLKDDQIVTGAGKTTQCTFRAAARETTFNGYLIVYNMRDIGEEDEMDQLAGVLPELATGTPCQLMKLLTEQNFTTPPSRYSEASLVKALEQNGVGRPSTFAATVSTIIERKYIAKEKLSLVPTQLGFSVNDYLVSQMPDLFNIGFTAMMEDKLDQVEEGKVNWIEMLKEFYSHFQEWIGNENLPPLLSDEEFKTVLHQIFPDGYEFDKPVKGSGATYNDEKFITGIFEQLEAGQKTLTERQQKAIMNIIAKYAVKDESLMARVRGTSLLSQVEALIKLNEEKSSQVQEEMKPEVLALMKAMKNITWEKPVKRGRRIYDDGKFFRSLERQVKNGRNLSAAQQQFLLKLASNYAGVIENFNELYDAAAKYVAVPASENSDKGSAETAAETAVKPEAPVMTDEQLETIALLFKLAEQIKNWKKPASKGRRTFNEQSFVLSLQEQFSRRHSLSEKQLSALCKILAHYSEEIPDYDKYSERLAKIVPRPRLLEEKCPECGAPLVIRYARGRSFIGCSGYPKCHYIAPKNKESKQEN